MNDKESCEPKILNYGPVRLIGLSRVCNTSADCVAAWNDENGFMAHAKDIQATAGEVPYYALCRCAKGAENGALEYVAAMPALDNIPMPEGMAEVIIPAGTYAEFPVAGLSEIGRVWGYTGEWLASNPEWKGFCDGNPDGCGCVKNPAFEFYPPGFNETDGLFIYVPIQNSK